MPRLDREQAISVAALVLLLLVSVSVVGMLFQTRSDAVQESSERREMLSRLEAKLRANASRPTAAAPPTAFLDASTPGLASAQLQSYLAQLAGDQRASLVSSGGEPAKRDDPPDTIRLQATLDMNLQGLRAVPSMTRRWLPRWHRCAGPLAPPADNTSPPARPSLPARNAWRWTH